MTLDQYIALGASVGACLSAIAALVTSWILLRQQRAVIQPRLVLSQTMVRSTRSHEIPIPRMWTETSNDRQRALRAHRDSQWVGKAVEKYADRRLFVNVTNSGVGSANEVRVRWTFPIGAAIHQVNHMASRDTALSFVRGRLYVKSDRTIESIGWRPHQRDSFDYISPVSSGGEPVRLAVPYAYAIVASSTVFYGEHATEACSYWIPPLRLDLLYRDIGRHKYKASFHIEFDPACSDPETGEVIYGFLRHRRRRRWPLLDWLHRFLHGHVWSPLWIGIIYRTTLRWIHRWKDR